MHASLWHFRGDPDDLLPRYDALLQDVGVERLVAHLCLRTRTGVLVVDTCPTEEAFQAFIAGDWFRERCEHHGLPAPDPIEDYPVHVAVAEGRVLHAPVG